MYVFDLAVDFEKGLTIEPNNKPILDELKKLPAPKKVPEKKAAVKVQPKVGYMNIKSIMSLTLLTGRRKEAIAHQCDR